MPRAVQHELTAIQNLATPGERLQAYRALHARLKQAREETQTLQSKYSLYLWMQHVKKLAAEERDRH